MTTKICRLLELLLVLLLAVTVCLVTVSCDTTPQVPGEDPGMENPGEPGGNEPGGNEPGGNQPGGNEPGGNEPGGNEPGDNEPEGGGNQGGNVIIGPGGVEGIPSIPGGGSQEDPKPDAHRHVFVVKEDVPATCLVNGWLLEACDCGEELRTERQATGHAYQNGICGVCGWRDESLHLHGQDVVEEQPATCVQDGWRLVRCGECGFEERIPLFSPGHSYNSTGSCTVCGYAKVHQCHWAEVSRRESCAESGTRQLRCYGCGLEKTEMIPPTGKHDQSYDSVGVCGLCGTRNNDVCTVCSWVLSDLETLPGCVTKGRAVYTCAGCHRTCRIPVPALGHSYAGGTCTQCGATEAHDCQNHLSQLYRKDSCADRVIVLSECTVCGKILAEERSPTGHAITPDCECFICGMELHAYTVLSEESAGCVEVGVKRLQCDICGHIKEQIVAPQEHDIGEDGRCLNCDFVRVGTHDCDFYLAHATAENCDAFGWQIWVCRICEGVKWEQPLPTPHHYKLVQEIVSTKGYVVREECCVDCDALSVTYGDSLSHAHVSVTVSDVLGGAKRLVCLWCGAELEAPDTTDHEHSYRTSRVEPECEAPGTLTTYCVICGYAVTESIPAPGHQQITVPRKDATCEENGHEAYIACATCGEALEEVVIIFGRHLYENEVCIRCGAEEPSDHAHEYEEYWKMDPTCTKPGTLTERCVHCWKQRQSVLPATGHSYDKGVCTACGAVDETTHVHEYEEIGYSILPTCERPGEMLEQCVLCGAERFVPVPALGHDYDERDVCKHCGAVNEKHEHMWVTLSETPASCEKSGKIKEGCVQCGAEREELLPALGHHYLDGICGNCGDVRQHRCLWIEISRTEACTGQGTRTLCCYGCGEEVIEPLAPLSHDDNYFFYGTCGRCSATNDAFCQHHLPVFSEVIREATCTERGVSAYSCMNCLQIVQLPTPALGHDFAGASCSRCGVALEHDCREHLRELSYYHSCTEEYTQIWECMLCGMIDQRICSPGHVMNLCKCEYCDYENHGWLERLPQDLTTGCTDAVVTKWECHECRKIVDEVRQPVGHSYASGVCTVCGMAQPGAHECDYVLLYHTEASCTEYGTQLWSCAICAGSVWADIEPQGHTFEEMHREFTQQGLALIVSRCEKCSLWRSEVGENAHVTVTVADASYGCTDERALRDICAICGTELRAYSSPAPGHTVEIDHADATCYTEGYHRELCVACGEVLLEEFYPAGHQLTEEVVNPTCKSDGYFKQYCKVCGEVTEEKVYPTVEHQYENGNCWMCGAVEKPEIELPKAKF